MSHITIRRSEKLVLQLRPSWLYFLRFYITGLPVTIILLNLGLSGISSLFLIMPILTVISRYSNLYTITNHRVVDLSGLIARETAEADLQDIVLINVRQSILDRLLNIGHIEIMSAANCDDADIVLGGVAKPFQVKETLWGLKNRKKLRRRRNRRR